jgi:hypothetical protein
LRSALAGAVALAAAGCLAPAASAQSFTCAASAIRGTVLGQTALEPVTANVGQAACRDAADTLGIPLPAPLGAGLVAARTGLTGADGPARTQRAVAAGGVTDLAVTALPSLPIALPVAQIPDVIRNLTLPVPGVLQLLGVPAQLTFGLTPAIDRLLPGGGLPNVDLLRVATAIAYAGAECRDGRAVPIGTSQVSGLRVLGQELPVGQVLERALTLIDTRNIVLSRLDAGQVALPAALQALPAPIVQQVLDTVLRPVIANLPTISIPPTIAQVKVTPGEQTTHGDSLVQRALRVQVSLLGLQLADLVVGEAAAGAAGVDCAPPAPEPPALQCTKRKLVLTDVVPAGRRVKLIGAADPGYAGRTVDIVFEGTGRRVARAAVGADGSFATTAPMPSRAVRNTNRARYVARIDREKSLDLKLMRRMVVESMTAKGGTVTIAGRVVRPLADPVAPIEVRRRVTCNKEQVVKRVKPRDDGSFRISVPAPDGEAEGVYRLATEVRKNLRNPKRYETFTLPRAVNLG